MSSAIKSFLVLLLAMPLMIYIGNEIGSDEYFFPVAVVFVTLAAIIVALFFRSQRLECLMLMFLIGGYLVGCRGFAQLSVVQPFFVGEVGMTIILAIMLIRYATTREFVVARHWLSALVGAFLVLAVIRLFSDFPSYGIDAIRDSAIVYYAVFFFAAYQLGRSPEVVPFVSRALVWVFFFQAVVATIFVLSPDTLELFQIHGVSPVSQKSDLTATFSALGIIFLALHPELFKLKWIRTLLILTLTADMVLTGSRAALVALCAALPFIWLAARRKFILIPILLVGFGFFGLMVAGSLLPERFISAQDQISSIFDFSGTHHYNTDFGESKQADNRFREVLWRSFVDQTVQENWLVGKGFGYNFIPIFEHEYNAGRWEGLRSAHNYFITVFGRLGLLGIVLFFGIVFETCRHGMRSALAMRRNETQDTSGLSYWCCALIIMASGAFGVVMEGPMGAIPLWTFLGLALAVDDRRALAAESEEPVAPLVVPLRERHQPARRPSMA